LSFFIAFAENLDGLAVFESAEFERKKRGLLAIPNAAGESFHNKPSLFISQSKSFLLRSKLVARVCCAFQV